MESGEGRKKMTNKERILRLVSKLDDNVSIDEVIYKLDVMKNIQIGLEQLDRGEFTEHEEAFRELLKDEAEKPDSLVAASDRRSRGNKKVHRPRLAAKRAKIH